MRGILGAGPRGCRGAPRAAGGGAEQGRGPPRAYSSTRVLRAGAGWTLTLVGEHLRPAVGGQQAQLTNLLPGKFSHQDSDIKIRALTLLPL